MKVRSLLPLMLSLLCACTQKPQKPVFPTGSELFASITAEVGAAEGEYSFLASVELEGVGVIVDKDWCSASVDGKKLVLKYSQNGENATRRALIMVSDPKGRNLATLSLLQTRGSLAFASGVGKLSLNARGEAVRLGVESDLRWEVSCDSGWLNVVAEGNELVVSAARNGSPQQRSARVTVSAGEISRVCVAEQEAASLVLAGSSLSLSAIGGEASLAVSCNVDWKVSGGSEWLTISKSDDAVLAAAEPNSGEVRTAEISISTGEELVRTVSIRQGSRYEALEGSWLLSGIIWLYDNELGHDSASLKSIRVSISTDEDGRTLLLHGFASDFLRTSDPAMRLGYDPATNSVTVRAGEEVTTLGFNSLVDESHDGMASIRIVELRSSGTGSSLAVQDYPESSSGITGIVSEKLDTISFPPDRGWGYGMWHLSDGVWTGSWCSYKYVGIVLRRNNF